MQIFSLLKGKKKSSQNILNEEGVVVVNPTEEDADK
jgi:hypothetical protein